MAEADQKIRVSLLTEKQCDDFKEYKQLPTEYRRSYINQYGDFAIENGTARKDSLTACNDVQLLNNLQELRINALKEIISLYDMPIETMLGLNVDTDMEDLQFLCGTEDNNYVTIEGLGSLTCMFRGTSPLCDQNIAPVANWFLSSDGFNGMYNQGTYKFCPLINTKSRSDCSGFVSSCLAYVGINKTGTQFTSQDYVHENSVIGKILQQHNFIKCDITDDFSLQGGDIVANRPIPEHEGHVFIVSAQKGKKWDFGGKRLHLPMNQYGLDFKLSNDVHTIWRYNGMSIFDSLGVSGIQVQGMDWVGKGGGYDLLNETITNLGYEQYRVFLNKTAKRESSGNMQAQSRISTACGWFGFLNNTRRNHSNLSREEFLNSPDGQVKAAVDLYKSNLQYAKNLGCYDVARQRGFTDEEIVTAFWLQPKAANIFFKSGNDQLADAQLNLTIMDVINKYRQCGMS